MSNSASPSTPISDEAKKDSTPTTPPAQPTVTSIPDLHTEVQKDGGLQTSPATAVAIAPPVEVGKASVGQDNQPRPAVSTPQPTSVPKVVPYTPASPTARPTHDKFGLARSSGQRGAEILAALRAELIGTPIAKALAKPLGLIIARLMIRTIPEKNVASVNYLAVRSDAIGALIKEAVKETPKPTIVDLGAGFNPRGIQLAFDLPHARVIEIDLPDVIREKRTRLKNTSLPQNITWLEADLGVLPLSQVLGGQQVHAIAAEGLWPYFSRNDQVRISRDLLSCLEPEGAFILDYAWESGANLTKSGNQFFSSQAGAYLGIVKNQEEVKERLREAGFGDIQVHLPAELADRYDLRKPVLNSQLIAVAKRPRKATS